MCATLNELVWRTVSRRRCVIEWLSEIVSKWGSWLAADKAGLMIRMG